MVLSGWGGVHFWGTWACVPFWLVYGVLYGSCCDSRWHEAGHGTAFKTAWMNDVVYHIASFMVMRNPVNWRWSHARHHTDTIIVGRDAEIGLMHPTNIWMKAQAFLSPIDAYQSLKTLAPQRDGQHERGRAGLYPGVRTAQGDLLGAGAYGDLCWPRC